MRDPVRSAALEEEQTAKASAKKELKVGRCRLTRSNPS